jgi:hypothetical protein
MDGKIAADAPAPAERPASPQRPRGLASRRCVHVRIARRPIMPWSGGSVLVSIVLWRWLYSRALRAVVGAAFGLVVALWPAILVHAARGLAAGDLGYCALAAAGAQGQRLVRPDV